jgi:hypothetical protein
LALNKQLSKGVNLIGHIQNFSSIILLYTSNQL